jgi:uncharacterized protein involved in exopolysaccharide biosynthesis
MAEKDFESGFDDASGEDDESGLDLERIRELVGFAKRAPRRHRRLSIGVLVAGLAATAIAFVAIPRTYSTEVKLLVQRNLVLPALGNPNRAVPREADNLTRNVADVVVERDNMISLVKQVDLVDRWDVARPPIQRVKDAVLRLIAEPPTEDEKMRALVGLVEKKLTVTAEDSTVTINVDWSDAEMAYELASTVQKNFLDAKYDAEVGVINEAIAILQKHLADENDNIGAALVELRGAEALSKPAASAATGSPAPRAQTASAGSVAKGAAVSSSADSALAALLEERRARIKTIQGAKDSQLAELNRQLSDALATLTPAHPTVLALKSRIEEAQKDPPELAALKNDEGAIVAQIAATAPAAPAARPPGDRPSSAAPTAAAAPATRASGNPPAEDPGVGVARYKLESATQKFTDLEARIESARIELDVARAAFKYRLSVVHPAEVPKKPVKPNVLALVLGGLLASLGMALGAAVLADLLGGRFVEASQVHRRLKLPLLGEVDSP